MDKVVGLDGKPVEQNEGESVMDAIGSSAETAWQWAKPVVLDSAAFALAFSVGYVVTLVVVGGACLAVDAIAGEDS